MSPPDTETTIPSHGAASLYHVSPDHMAAQAEVAAAFLKALAHPGRMMILCHLGGGERSVTELETLLGARQAAVSQQLARLRAEGLVRSRRDGKSICYSLGDAKVIRTIGLLNDMFCREG